MTLPKTTTAILGSIAALAILPASAGSTDDSVVKTINVSISGYDLTDPADAKTVLSKIQRAAKRVCRNSQARQTLQERAEEFACRTSAISEAVNNLDFPELNAALEETKSTS